MIVLLRTGSGQVSLRAANIMDGRYIYMEDLLGLEECMDRECKVSWPTSPSPICLNNWMEFLALHPDQRFAAYIQSGLATGFRIGFNHQWVKLKSAARNHPSALANTSVVRDYIRMEQEAG